MKAATSHSSSNGRDIFIVSEVSFDQLYNRGRNLRFLSSMQLLQRIQTPATGIVPVRSQSVALHTRLTSPILCLLNIAIALPLVFRKESHSLIANMATCATVLGALYGVTEACFAMGEKADAGGPRRLAARDPDRIGKHLDIGTCADVAAQHDPCLARSAYPGNEGTARRPGQHHPRGWHCLWTAFRRLCST